MVIGTLKAVGVAVAAATTAAALRVGPGSPESADITKPPPSPHPCITDVLSLPAASRDRSCDDSGNADIGSLPITVEPGR